jgi:hypothetical protein
MTMNALELALWDMHDNKSLAAGFHEDVDSLLNQYRLSGEERTWIKELDVRAMAEKGADQMLLFVAWIALNGLEQIPEYMRRMNTPRA